MVYRVAVTGHWRRPYATQVSDAEAHEAAFRVNAITPLAAEHAARQLFAATAASKGALADGCEARASGG